MADYPFIPPKTIEKMRKLQISEKDLYDVWTSGEHFNLPSGMDAMKKKYEGWGEIGLTYVRRYNGEYVVTSVWTRARQ